MTEITGSYFFLDNELISASNIDVKFLSRGINVYEVLRFANKIPLFFENHFERLINSSTGNKLCHNITLESLRKKVNKLIEVNPEKEGNLKIVLHSESKNICQVYIYQTPHYYPSENDYVDGVKIISIQEGRPNPNLKSWRPDFKKSVYKLKQKYSAYDVLLVENGIIREGSQSNFFAIIGDRILTAPGENVLKGITRKIVFQICKEKKIDIVEMDFSMSDLNDAAAIFLTGTSPGIIPVSKLDDMSFP
ncbi:MAG: aminotransferase class IV, partial [Bacteroidales bacterium]|nr:aminotransferase class IV [Bacteroidales bacterium]